MGVKSNDLSMSKISVILSVMGNRFYMNDFSFVSFSIRFIPVSIVVVSLLMVVRFVTMKMMIMMMIMRFVVMVIVGWVMIVIMRLVIMVVIFTMGVIVLHVMVMSVVMVVMVGGDLLDLLVDVDRRLFVGMVRAVGIALCVVVAVSCGARR